MNWKTKIKRREMLRGGSTLSLLPILSACMPGAQAPITPGIFTQKSLVPPPYIKPSANGYTAPVGRFDVHDVVINKQRRQYHAYRTKMYTTPPSSVLLLLHGSNRNGASLVDKWSKLADRHNILLVAPDSLNGQSWDPNKDAPAVMKGIITHAQQTYAVSDVPLYGFGHSAGAILMTLLSIQDGSLFERVAVHAGYLSVDQARISKKHADPKPPLAHFLGSNDHIFNMDVAIQSAEMLALYGQDTTLITLKGHTHWYYDLAPFINKHAWGFLSSGT